MSKPEKLEFYYQSYKRGEVPDVSPNSNVSPDL